jgi:hypothetical protein
VGDPGREELIALCLDVHADLAALTKRQRHQPVGVREVESEAGVLGEPRLALLAVDKGDTLRVVSTVEAVETTLCDGPATT